MKKHLFEKQDIPNLRAVVALNRAVNRLNRRGDAIFRAHGLSTMQFAVLEALYHKGDLTVGEIIEAILSTGGNMTVVLNNLVREGLVAKRQNSNDLRVTLISLTPAGEEKMQEVFPAYVADLRQALCAVPPEEKRLVAQTVRRWAAESPPKGQKESKT